MRKFSEGGQVAGSNPVGAVTQGILIVVSFPGLACGMVSAPGESFPCTRRPNGTCGLVMECG
jgi:hypothetical protein